MTPAPTQLFPWTKALETGHPDMDREHRQLVAYLNDLAAAMRTGQGKSVLKELLDKLVGYTKTHFSHEELLMTVRKYPQIAEQKRQHEEFTHTVLDFVRDFNDGKAVFAPEVLEFLKQWLRTHICGTDRRLGQWLLKG